MSIGYTSRVELCLAAQPQSIAPLRRAVVTFARDHGASAPECDDIALAVSEALSNVVVHAYVGRDRPGDICVRAWTEDDALQISVCDDGIGMVPRPDSPGLGLGLAIIGRVADHVQLESRDDTPGLRVHMTFVLP